MELSFFDYLLKLVSRSKMADSVLRRKPKEINRDWVVYKVLISANFDGSRHKEYVFVRCRNGDYPETIAEQAIEFVQKTGDYCYVIEIKKSNSSSYDTTLIVSDTTDNDTPNYYEFDPPYNYEEAMEDQRYDRADEEDEEDEDDEY